MQTSYTIAKISVSTFLGLRSAVAFGSHVTAIGEHVTADVEYTKAGRLRDVAATAASDRVKGWAVSAAKKVAPTLHDEMLALKPAQLRNIVADRGMAAAVVGDSVIVMAKRVDLDPEMLDVVYREAIDNLQRAREVRNDTQPHVAMLRQSAALQIAAAREGEWKMAELTA